MEISTKDTRDEPSKYTENSVRPSADLAGAAALWAKGGSRSDGTLRLAFRLADRPKRPPSHLRRSPPNGRKESQALGLPLECRSADLIEVIEMTFKTEKGDCVGSVVHICHS